MVAPHDFDQFYKDVRTRLLVLTYCLTGDLASSRSAVRDAFVVAWHHWRKVARYDDPEAWIRERATGHAQRRHTAKLWHREKGLDPEVEATLDALGKLPLSQRKVLLLTELSTASLEQVGREVGLPRAEAERQLQSATAQLAINRNVPTTSIRRLFDPVRAHVEHSRWPRATIVRRSGAARRRTHTVVGVAATVAALVVTGAVVTDSAGARPNLTGERVDSGASGPSAAARPTPKPVDLPADKLLGVRQVAATMPGTGWRITGTDDNAAGDGVSVPCQESRYAGRRPSAALVRTFETRAKPRKPRTMAVQAAEAAPSTAASARAYDTAVEWFAACTDPQAQLVSTHRVDGLGDRARILVLRLWDAPASAVVAGVARTGRFTTTTVTRLTGTDRPDWPGRPDLRRSARLLASAVNGLCDLPQAGSCAAAPRLTSTAPVPVGPTPAMVSEVDLPPVPRVHRPWVGTEAHQARDNDAATNCDHSDFSSRRMSNSMTRTFLIPGAKLPAQFGLTETVGSLPEAKARSFVDEVRVKLTGCADKQMGTEVRRQLHVDGKHRDLTVWHVTTEISDHVSVDFLMGIARDRTAIAQVGFVPDRSVTMAPEVFDDLVQRAQERLRELPAPQHHR